jgi:putative FmdB family regulatory protein
MTPVYEYACRSCGHTFDDLEPMSAPKVRGCPKCDKDGTADRQVSDGVGLSFKGDGYFVTDYDKKNFS